MTTPHATGPPFGHGMSSLSRTSARCRRAVGIYGCLVRGVMGGAALVAWDVCGFPLLHGAVEVGDFVHHAVDLLLDGMALLGWYFVEGYFETLQFFQLLKLCSHECEEEWKFAHCGSWPCAADSTAARTRTVDHLGPCGWLAVTSITPVLIGFPMAVYCAVSWGWMQLALHLWWNDGKGHFPTSTKVGPALAWIRMGAAGDFDGDGQLDLA